MQERDEESGGAAQGDREGNSRGESEYLTFEEFYKDIAIDCFRYLGMRSLDEVDRMTMQEYNWLMEAEQLKRVDRERDIHWLAFLNQAVRATSKSGKPRFDKFNKFFDYEEEIREITGEKKKSKLSGLSRFLKAKQEKENA